MNGFTKRKETTMLGALAKKQFQQLSVLHSSYAVIKDPNNLKEVLSLSEQLLELAQPEDIRKFAEEICRDPKAIAAIEERYRVEADLAKLAKCRKGSLGRSYIEHLEKNGITPESLTPPPVTDDLTYFAAHIRETHDIWHAVTGFATSVTGELGLAAFGAAQMPSQFEYILLSGGLLNTVLYKFDEREGRMQAIVDGWQMGKKAKPLFGVRWTEMWDEPLTQVRKSLKIA
jgi:ubiquinone biosynthesis protein COQ4